jgi:hypothetical protein
MWQNAIMIKTQVQLPDKLYYQAKAIAEQREWSLAEVIRRGIEYMAQVYPVQNVGSGWSLPVLKSDAFAADFDELDFKSIVAGEELRTP